MANIVITSGANHWDIVTNDQSGKFKNRAQVRIKKVSICDIGRMELTGYSAIIVQYITGSEKELTHEMIDSIDGNTDITSNQKLYDALIAII